ncbi:MAG: hypothetical protein ACFB21_01245 [Opitutales bacterium]
MPQILQNDYPEKLHPLIRLGARGTGYQDPLPYREKFELSESDELELLRLAQDCRFDELNCGNPAVWAPFHATRALGQVGGADLVEPLLTLLNSVEEDDDSMHEAIPQALAWIGPAALAHVDAAMFDPNLNSQAKASLTGFYAELVLKHPNTRPLAVKSLVGIISNFAKFESSTNGLVISYLIDFQVKEALPTIRFAYLSNCVDETVLGDFDDVVEAMETLPSGKS